MFDWLRSPRTRAIREVNRRMGRLETMAKDGLEDDYLEDMLDRMDRLESLWEPDETTPTPAGILPQYLPIWNQIPEKYRGMASGAVKFVSGVTLEDALSDPTGDKLRLVIEKAGPWINRIGGLDALKGFLPKDLKAPAALPPSTTLHDPYYKPPD